MLLLCVYLFSYGESLPSVVYLLYMSLSRALQRCFGVLFELLFKCWSLVFDDNFVAWGFLINLDCTLMHTTKVRSTFLWVFFFP